MKIAKNKFKNVTSNAAVEAFKSTNPIFIGILKEVRELSKKKPEATISIGKVKIINRVLADLLVFLKEEPSGKYLEELDSEALPQLSDAVLTMVQFETALKAFKDKYYQKTDTDLYGSSDWITHELLKEWD